MSRTTLIVLIALGAAIASFAFSSVARTLREDQPDDKTSVAAGAQAAELGWRETYGKAGEQLIFSVESLEVRSGGWRARVSIENETSVSYEVGDPRATLDRSFGLMLFSTGDVSELEERNANGTLPAVRTASRYEPALPKLLEPGAAWKGTISARGALVADSWVRVVFGTLISIGTPPDELGEDVVWITDHAHPLRR